MIDRLIQEQNKKSEEMFSEHKNFIVELAVYVKIIKMYIKHLAVIIMYFIGIFILPTISTGMTLTHHVMGGILLAAVMFTAMDLISKTNIKKIRSEINDKCRKTLPNNNLRSKKK